MELHYKYPEVKGTSLSINHNTYVKKRDISIMYYYVSIYNPKPLINYLIQKEKLNLE
jgi:hypothetical protein